MWDWNTAFKVILYLRTLAGIIWDSGAASIRDCHVLVELGMTNPNSKNHSSKQRPCTKILVSNPMNFVYWLNHFKENFLLKAELLHGLSWGKIYFPRDGAALEDFCRHSGLMLNFWHGPKKTTKIKASCHLAAIISKHSQIVGSLPQNFSSVCVSQVHPVAGIEKNILQID